MARDTAIEPPAASAPRRAVSGRRLGWAVLAAVAAGVAIAGVSLLRTTAPAASVVLDAATAAAGRGDFVSARRAAGALRDRGRATEAALAQAAILLAKNLPQPAIDTLAEVPASGPLDPRRRLLLADAAHRLGRHLEVASLLLPLVEQSPDLVEAHRLLAASFYDTGAVTRALEHLHETARLAPEDPRPHRLLGLMHNDFERYDEAIPLYEESLRRGPDQSSRDDVLLELATCLAKQLRYDEAIAVLDRRPRSASADVVRAECLLATGDHAAAGKLLDAVVAAADGSQAVPEADLSRALVLKGQSLLDDGEAAAAVAVLERAAEDPHDYLAHHTLATALAAAGRDDEAARRRTEAEAIRGRRETFSKLHQEAWEKPWDADVRLRLAAAAAALGRPDLERVWRAAAAAVQQGGVTP
ncbi:MAG: tetratricopeptide repeat protein [Planctomycetia bacterium]